MAKKTKQKQGPHIFWRNGRAYADFRAYEDVGGGRGALSEEGASWGTTDPEIAETLFARQLTELQEKRRGRVGTPTRRSIRLDALVRDHLKKKRLAGQTSHSHMIDLEYRLEAAAAFFGSERDPASIEPADVQRWVEALTKGGKRKPGTVRHYLNALSGLFRRAIEGLCVAPGYNPVAMLQEKPTGYRRTEAAFFEVSEAALLLEAARIIEARKRRNAVKGLHAIVATFLLTGGRAAEVLGLDVEDVSFDRGLVRFRPNDHRGLKTSTSVREVPLWPQLREILQGWMYPEGETPRVSGLLFPAIAGGVVGDLRKSLEEMGALCGMEPGEVRTRRFRHTYCSARLQTVQRILKPGRAAEDPDAWEYVEVSRFQVQKEMGHGGGQLVNRIYGHAQRTPHRSEAVEFNVAEHREALGDRLRSLVAAEVG